jgi:hypothetical protein
MPNCKQNQSKIYLNQHFFIVFTKKTSQTRKNCEKCRMDAAECRFSPKYGVYNRYIPSGNGPRKGLVYEKCGKILDGGGDFGYNEQVWGPSAPILYVQG